MERAGGQFKGQVLQDFASATIAHANVFEANRGRIWSRGDGVVDHGGADCPELWTEGASVLMDWSQGVFESRP
jgi:hypothetical protein